MELEGFLHPAAALTKMQARVRFLRVATTHKHVSQQGHLVSGFAFVTAIT